MEEAGGSSSGGPSVQLDASDSSERPPGRRMQRRQSLAPPTRRSSYAADASGSQQTGKPMRLQTRGALTDLCFVIADLALHEKHLDDAFDVTCSLVGMLRSEASGVASSAETALSALIAPTREHCHALGGAILELSNVASKENEQAMQAEIPAQRVERLLRRNSGLDMKCASAARKQQGAPEWSDSSERRTLQVCHSRRPILSFDAIPILCRHTHPLPPYPSCPYPSMPTRWPREKQAAFRYWWACWPRKM